jgi:hypothetical protein
MIATMALNNPVQNTPFQRFQYPSKHASPVPHGRPHNPVSTTRIMAKFLGIVCRAPHNAPKIPDSSERKLESISCRRWLTGKRWILAFARMTDGKPYPPSPIQADVRHPP